jgi:hypothetical protein
LLKIVRIKHCDTRIGQGYRGLKSGPRKTGNIGDAYADISDAAQDLSRIFDTLVGSEDCKVRKCFDRILRSVTLYDNDLGELMKAWILRHDEALALDCLGKGHRLGGRKRPKNRSLVASNNPNFGDTPLNRLAAVAFRAVQRTRTRVA